VLSVVAALWAIAVALSARGTSDRGLLVHLLRSPWYPLVISVACGLAAWAVSLGTPDEMRTSPPARKGKFVARLTLMVVALNLLLLAQPDTPPNFMACQFVNPIGRGFIHFLNCDSPEYLGLARDPSLVFSHGILQARPLSFYGPHLLAESLRLVPRLEKAGPYRPYARHFVAYLLINLVALVTALVCFTRVLERGAGQPAGVELLVSLVALSANDVTKLFFWTPHTQIFGLFVPCLTLYLSFRLLTRAEPLRPGAAAVLGLALGVGALYYGLFVVPAICIGAIHVLVYRRLWPAALVCAGALLPYAVWAATVYALIGSFYNHEVGMYRQFVWMSDCAKVSVASCGPAFRTRLLSLFTTAAPVLFVPVLLAVGCRAASYIRPAASPQPPMGALARAAVFTFVTIAVFQMLQGAPAPRLSWQMVPPVLLMAAVEFQHLRRAWPGARMQVVNAGIALASLVYVLMLAARQGPYN
jgi:hypothetical protein